MLAKLSVVIFLVVLGIYLYSRNKNAHSNSPVNSDALSSQPTTKTGSELPSLVKATPEVQVDLDWASERLQSAVSEWQNASLVEQQLLFLNQVINECYKQRRNSQYRIYGQSIRHAFLVLIQQLLDTLSDKQAKHAGVSFMQLASLAQESAQFEQAIALCEQALTYNLTDGTKTGFEGRITRIKRAQEKHQ